MIFPGLRRWWDGLASFARLNFVAGGGFWLLFGLTLVTTIWSTSAQERAGNVQIVIDVGTLVLAFWAATAIPWAFAASAERRAIWVPETIRNLEEVADHCLHLADEIREADTDAMTSANCLDWMRRHRTARAMFRRTRRRFEALATPSMAARLRGLSVQVESALSSFRQCSEGMMMTSSYRPTSRQMSVAADAGRTAADACFSCIRQLG